MHLSCAHMAQVVHISMSESGCNVYWTTDMYLSVTLKVTYTLFIKQWWWWITHQYTKGHVVVVKVSLTDVQNARSLKLVANYECECCSRRSHER